MCLMAFPPTYAINPSVKSLPVLSSRRNLTVASQRGQICLP